MTIADPNVPIRTVTMEVEVDPLKVKSFEEALHNFNRLAHELNDAADAVRRAMFDLGNGFVIRRVEE